MQSLYYPCYHNQLFSKNNFFFVIFLWIIFSPLSNYCPKFSMIIGYYCGRKDEILFVA